jgi:hypothetical protein
MPTTPSWEEQIGGNGRLYKGEDKTLLWRIRDYNTNLPVDIAAWDMYFTVKQKDKDPDSAILIEKDVDVIGAYNVVEASNTQYARVRLEDTDTQLDATTAGKYYRYSLKRTEDGQEDVLRAGDFVVQLATQT